MHISIKVCSGIYKITNVVNNKVYIGCSSYIPNRWLYHRFNLNLGRHTNYRLQKDWIKFGANSFMFSLLEYIHDPVRLYEREKELIQEFAEKQEIYNIKV